jgi:hypothetical protein
MIGDMNSSKLYVLRGSTLPSIAAAVTSDEPSKTNLWHARHGHMNEHDGMAIDQERAVSWLQHE